MPFDAFSLKWRKISLGWFPRNRLGIIKSEKQISQEEEMPFINWNRIEIEWFIEYPTSGKDWIDKVYNVWKNVMKYNYKNTYTWIFENRVSK